MKKKTENLFYIFWRKWLIQSIHWLPTVIHFPFLYLLGWVAVQPLEFIFHSYEVESFSLLGTIISFGLFLYLLPSWVKIRWQSGKPLEAVGLLEIKSKRTLRYFLKGFLLSLAFILIIVFCLFSSSYAIWKGDMHLSILLNAVFLGLGVGFAEELIFRGWLWGELDCLIGSPPSIFAQAVIFSLSHIRLDLDIFSLLGLFVGLFLLGLVLALRRFGDRGSIWGAIGLHGGLVGVWFLLTSDLIEITPNAPIWLVGPGNLSPNPLGGAVAIASLSVFIMTQRTALARAGSPFKGALNASSREATP